MPSYTGYSGYGSPERAKVDRARQMAELLQQGATDTSPKSFWEGAAQLGKAFIARGAMDKADKAETSYAKNQERLLRHFMDPNTTEDGYAMQPTINVGADPEPQAATPAPASPMPKGDQVKALARALGGVYEGDGKTADVGVKQVDVPPMQPPAQPGASPQVQSIAAALGATPSPQAVAPAMAPSPQMAAPTMAAPPAMAQAPQSFRPPPPAAPNRQAALMTAMRMTGGNLQQAMSLVEAKYGPAPQGMSAYEAEQIRLREAELARADDDKLTTEVGGNGNFWSFNTASGKMEDTGVKAPASRVSGDAGASGVQSVHVDQGTGRATAVMRDGSTKDLGFQPVQTQVVDVGGVPTLVSKIPGTQNQPLSTSTEVGTNQGAIEGFKALGKVQADAIKVLPEAISTSERVIQSIDELLNAPGFKGAYGVNRFLPQNMVPGSDAKNADAIRGKLDGQFFVNAVTAMQVSLAPVSDADALRLVASISQLTNPDISDAEALRVGNELKGYFRKAKAKAEAAAKRGPMKTDLSNAPVTAPAAGATNTRVGVPYLLAKPQNTAAGIPDGVDPEDWKYMSDEQKALFQ